MKLWVKTLSVQSWVLKTNPLLCTWITPVHQYADRPEQCHGAAQIVYVLRYVIMFVTPHSYIVSYPYWIKLHFWCGNSKLQVIHLVLTGLCSLPLMYSHLHCIKSSLRSSTDITPYFTNYTSWQNNNTYQVFSIHIHIPIYFLTSCLSWK